MADILEIVLLAFVGLAAGVINTLAGGGSAFTLPVFNIFRITSKCRKWNKQNSYSCTIFNRIIRL